jgi:MFS transporter, ACS family, hexuronate transporter
MTANRNYQWLLIGVLSMHFGVVFFDRNAFSFLTPNIQEEMKLSLTQIGLIGGAFSAAWALAGLVMGSLSDRFGHRKAILIVATLVFSLSSVLSGLAPTFVLLLGARMLMGVAEGGIMPITQTLIATEVAPERRGLAQGITQNFGANLLANSLGPIIVAWMATHYGWRNAFFLVAIPGFVMALVLALCVREPRHIKDGPKPTVADSVQLLKDPTILVCVALSILLVAYFVIWSSFMPLFLMQNKGFSQQAMGGIMSAMGFASIAIAFIVPGLSDRLGRKPVAIVAGLLGAVMPLGALLIDSTSPVPYYAAFAIGATVTGVFPMAMATVPSEIVPPSLTATALSLTMGISEIVGGVVGPPVAGRIGDAFGLGAAMWILAVVSIGVAVVALLLRETAPLVLAKRAQARAALAKAA